jgi:hypothetical protein
LHREQAGIAPSTSLRAGFGRAEEASFLFDFAAKPQNQTKKTLPTA